MFEKQVRIESRVAKTIRFVGEQNGVPEKEFKDCVVSLLHRFGFIGRAYLARVTYESSSGGAVALCFSGEQPQHALFENVATAFASMFKPEQHLDILMIDLDQEKELVRVCSPFFEDIMRAEFYLASTESAMLERPRRCHVIARLTSEFRDDYMLISIDPPLNGQMLGLGARDLDQVLIANRHQGDSLFPINRWPMFVHVARLCVPYKGQVFVNNAQIASLAWGELYATEAAARAKTM
jgi:hypothetical protein